MLKQRAKMFLETYTPRVTAAIQAFTVCQHDALYLISQTMGRGVTLYGGYISPLGVLR